MADKIKAPRWDLESIFPDGSKSKEFEQFRQKIKDNLEASDETLQNLSALKGEVDYKKWGKLVLDMQELIDDIKQAYSFAGCLISQDVNDAEGHRIDAELSVYSARWYSIMTGLESFALKLSDVKWKDFITTAGLEEIRFFLDEMRDIAKNKMSPEFEKLAISLSVDGYHAWNRLYDKMAGDLRVDFTENGKTKKISLGQLAPKMDSPDKDVRRTAFEKLTEVWESQAELAAMTLNSIAGFRLTLYENRKWDSPLYEPLIDARLKPETLEAMWSVVSNAVPGFKKYIMAKKKLLGIDKFMWYDQTAPVGKLSKIYTYDEAGDFIVEHLSSFSPEMGKFSKMALDKKWIEADDRTGKAAGGFCTGFPINKESRIFMTFTGTYGGLSTLAHELGHAYHGWVLKDKPSFISHYPMTLAETASTFNELRVTDAALETALDPQEKLMLIDQKLQNAYIYFCNIHARFLFDVSFYEERKNGMVSRNRLDELMMEVQKKAYAGTIDGYHPIFWASKLHFFFTGIPFYNFPYTFGFLFAMGIYDRALREGQSFAKDYRALLADTGNMNTEDVAKKHLGVDLTKEDYWVDAVDRVMADIEPFVKLAEEIG